jgi:5-methylcytosine-specific restriction enzyme subunit McrC
VAIPIQNIYYLLSYAWDKLDEGRKVAVSTSDYHDSVELLARVLTNGCNILLKRGLDRSYRIRTEEYVGVKGKIDFGSSLKNNSFRRGKAICEFDEFEADVLHNQLLKATLLRLTRIQGLDQRTLSAVWNSYSHLRNISDIELQQRAFAMVRIHRNNSIYEFLLKICRLIIDSSVLDEKSGRYVFREFIGDEKVMASLFEGFVRNFYRRELPDSYRGRENIRWAATAVTNSNTCLLPIMQTDVTLEVNNKKVIVDAKYYARALSSYYDTEKIHSTNLYQIYSYLRNLEEDFSNPLNMTCEGILLYPTVSRELNESFVLGSHRIHIATVNLNSDWRSIERRLISLVQPKP